MYSQFAEMVLISLAFVLSCILTIVRGMQKLSYWLFDSVVPRVCRSACTRNPTGKVTLLGGSQSFNAGIRNQRGCRGSQIFCLIWLSNPRTQGPRPSTLSINYRLYDLC